MTAVEEVSSYFEHSTVATKRKFIQVASDSNCDERYHGA
jgi:hypothetical protein